MTSKALYEKLFDPVINTDNIKSNSTNTEPFDDGILFFIRTDRARELIKVLPKYYIMSKKNVPEWVTILCNGIKGNLK